MIFAIQVKAGTEYLVAKYIEATANERSQNVIRVLIPTSEIYDLKQIQKGKAKKKIDILLPTYLFLEVETNIETSMPSSLYNYLKSLTSNIRHILKDSIPENELSCFLGESYSFVEFSFNTEVFIEEDTPVTDSSKPHNLTFRFKQLIQSFIDKKTKASLSLTAFLRNKKVHLSIPLAIIQLVVQEASLTIKDMSYEPKMFLSEVLRIYEQSLNTC